MGLTPLRHPGTGCRRAAATALLTWAGAGASAGQGGHIDIPLPALWVPFTAEVETTSHGSPTTAGVFHRRGDGSTALRVQTPRGDIITIHDVATGTTYLRVGDDQGWTRTGLSESLRQPPPRSLRLPEFRTHELPGQVEGLDVWEMVATGARGVVVNHHVPALNGFTILTDWLGSSRHEFRNIRIGEPPPEVFLPPPGTEFGDDGPRHARFP